MGVRHMEVVEREQNQEFGGVYSGSFDVINLRKINLECYSKPRDLIFFSFQNEHASLAA